MADWRISGDPRTVGCTGSNPGDHVTDIDTSTVYVKHGTGTTDFTPCTSAYNSGGSGILTVEEADGSPSYANIGILQADSTTGLVVTQPAANKAKVELSAVPQSVITNLTTDLAGKAALSHTHAESDVTSLVADLAAKEATANKNAVGGYAGLDGSSKLTGSQQTYGSSANTACEGNDSRLTNSRSPTAHATSHKDGGSDEIASATPGSGVIPKAGAGGNLAIGFLATGTPSGAKFVRDDGTLQVPSGTGAPVGASYVTLGTDATLTSERVLTGSTAVSVTDAGAGSTVTLDLNTGGVATAKLADASVTLAKMANMATTSVIGRTTASAGVPEVLTVAAPLTATGGTLDFDETATLGNNARVAVAKGGSLVGTRRKINVIEGTNITLTVADDSANEKVDITIAGPAGTTGAPTGAQYLTLATDATLTAERVATAGTGITITDAGAGSTATFAMDVNGLSAASDPQPFSDYIPLYDNSGSAVKKMLMRDLWGAPRYRAILEEDFYSTTLGNGLTITGTAGALQAGTSAHPGVYGIGPGTATAMTLVCHSTSNKPFVLGGGKLRYVFVGRMPNAVSDNTNNYSIWIGLGDNTSGTTPTPSNGVGFFYNHATNSGKFQIVATDGTPATQDTSQAMSGIANTYVCFEFEVNAAASSVQAYINGSAAGSAVTTHIPTANLGVNIALATSAGTKSALNGLHADALQILWEPSTAR